MSKEINLIAQRKRGVIKNKRLTKFFRLSSAFFLFSVAFLSIAIFILKSTSPIGALQQEENSALNQISKLDQKVVKFLLLQGRLRDISSIINKRTKFDQTLNLMTKEMPSNISIVSLSVNKKNLTITLVSTSLLSLNTFIDGILNKTNRDGFSRVMLDSLALDQKTGKYFLSVNIDMK